MSSLLLFSLLVLFNVIDAATTTYMIHEAQSFDIEANPFMHWLLVTSGTVWALWLYKLGALAFLGVVCWEYKITLAILSLMYAGVAISNLVVIILN